MTTKVLIQIEGGLIQSIFTDKPDVQIIIQDFDVEGSDGYYTWNDGTEFLAWNGTVIVNESLIDDVQKMIDNDE